MEKPAEPAPKPVHFVTDTSPFAVVTRTFTREEWNALTKDDELVSFFKEVNEVASAKSYWPEDFRRAFYDAANEVYTKRLLAKYNNGEPLSITGAFK